SLTTMERMSHLAAAPVSREEPHRSQRVRRPGAARHPGAPDPAAPRASLRVYPRQTSLLLRLAPPRASSTPRRVSREGLVFMGRPNAWLPAPLARGPTGPPS